MLARAFKSHTELQLTQPIYEGLKETLTALESGKLEHTSDYSPHVPNGFNMNTHWCVKKNEEGECGTVGCIAGWAAHYAGMRWFDLVKATPQLRPLFYPYTLGDLHCISPKEAAYALRKYLETGVISWAHMKTKPQMLAKTFKSHIELGLTSELCDALQKVLQYLEQGILVHDYRGTTSNKYGFNMSLHFLESLPRGTECGAVGCIVGWAGHFMGKDWRAIVSENDHIYELFYPNEYREIKLSDISVDEAALALRTYLETGNIDWSHVPELEYKDYDD